jgi:NTP pyrophosphatase (non-canonical NTP hydrolase)
MAMDLKQMQQEIDAWCRQWDPPYWPPLANLARLTEEVGELARELNHRYGPKQKKPTEDTADLALELGDILFVVGALANQLGIDLEAGFKGVMDKYRQRDANRWKRAGAGADSGADSGADAGSRADAGADDDL